MQPLIEDLRSLGPEGTIVAELTQGFFVATTAFASFGETLQKHGAQALEAFKNYKDGVGSFLDMLADPNFAAVAISAIGALSAAVGSLQAVMNAAAQNRIAHIDKEIAAEKKRDGKSVESQRRLDELEKRKEKQKRKSFEQNKKFMMAQAIMATAAGAIGIAAGLTMLGPPGIAMIPAAVGMILALGACLLYTSDAADE